ncbi:MAG: hypothetical protein MJB14_02150 [Spirochaetes bacterium]|nr:hypothetical protein [Spirochaetota bacterium]
MGLLLKALKYRDNFVKKPKGLLQKALAYLESKNAAVLPPTSSRELISEVERQVEKEALTIQAIPKKDIVTSPVEYQPEDYYINLLNQLSKELSTFVIDEQAYSQFNSILSRYFKLAKTAILVYSPLKNQFVYWNGINIDKETTNKLEISLDFSNIFKTISKEKSYFVRNTDSEFEYIKNILSEKDYQETDFQLWVPFIFSARIIGIFLILKKADQSIPDQQMIHYLEMLCRLNGPLLYNLYQQELLKNKSITKSNETITIEEELDEEIREEQQQVEEKIEDKIIDEELVDIDYDNLVEKNFLKDVEPESMFEIQETVEEELEELGISDEDEISEIDELEEIEEAELDVIDEQLDDESMTEIDVKDIEELDLSVDEEITQKEQPPIIEELQENIPVEINEENEEIDVNINPDINLDKPISENIQTIREHIEHDKTDNMTIEEVDEQQLEDHLPLSESEEIDYSAIGEETEIAEDTSLTPAELSVDTSINENLVNLDEIIEEKYHTIIHFLKDRIDNNPDENIVIIKIEITNADELEKDIPQLKLHTFYDDIQFVVMNIVGINGYVKIYDNLSIYILMPEIGKKMAIALQDEVITNINNMFNEIFGELNIDYLKKVSCYPDDSKDFIKLFLKVQ